MLTQSWIVRALTIMLLFIKVSMVHCDKDVIRDVNGFYLTLIMDYL